VATLKEAIDLYGQGRLNEAERTCRAILLCEPQNFEALYAIGSIKLQQQMPAEARQYFEQAIAIQPDSERALFALAYTLLMLNRPVDALAVSDRVLAFAPNHVGAWVTRGNALFRSKRSEEALASYDEALRRADNDTEALIARGTALAALGRADDAVATFERIPTNPSNLHKRADLLRNLGLFAAAARDYRRLTEISPHALFGWEGLIMCAQESCDWGALEDPRRRILAAVNAGQRVDPLLMLRISSDPAEHLKCATTAAPRAAPTPFFTAPAGSRPTQLRIAYISPDFRSHTLAYLIPELLERHDRARFEVIGVSLGPPDDSDIRARIIKAFAQFHEVRSLSDEQVVTLLRELKVGIAIDLAGYTKDGRPGILARRVAPIQVSYLGYCGTSGSNFIDYLLADRIVVPPEQQRFFTEKLVYLPDTFMVADSTHPVSNASPRRSEYGLPDDGFVFCCFNMNYKITQTVFDVWMRLLRSVEGSVLWLSANLGRGRDNLRRYAEAQGIDPQRLVFAPPMAARADHFARHILADLFLDTLPYNAHTTACDALFAGLPVLTVIGPAFVGRVAASLLHAIGLDELIAPSLEAYENIALGLAQDPARMRALRAKLATNRRTQPLLDTDRFRRSIERAYEQMFELYLRGEQPRSFEVAAEQTKLKV
jgi:protein O-GlcNAc transferase